MFAHELDISRQSPEGSRQKGRCRGDIVNRFQRCKKHNRICCGLSLLINPLCLQSDFICISSWASHMLDTLCIFIVHQNFAALQGFDLSIPLWVCFYPTFRQSLEAHVLVYPCVIMEASFPFGPFFVGTWSQIYVARRDNFLFVISVIIDGYSFK